MSTRPALLPTRSLPAARAASWLTATTAALVAGVSAVGLFTAGLYTDGAAVEAMFRGFDLITLVVVAPLLAASLLPGWRDRPVVQLVRLSLLAYCIYNYAYYLFGAGLNAALLAHIAAFAAALYALVLSLVALDVHQFARHFREATPVRTVTVIVLLLAVPLAAFQVSGLAGFALAGAVPDEPSPLVVPLQFTRLGAVLDLSLLVPAYLLAAVWLWRRRPWGLLLATIVLVAGMLHQLSYVSAMLYQLSADVPGAAFDLYEPAIIALYLLGSVLLLANLRTLVPTVTAPTQERVPAQVGRRGVRVHGQVLIR
jgi:hypothetical protein